MRTRPEPPQTVIARMARAMVAVRASSSDDNCTDSDLIGMGFTRADIRDHGEAAREAAAKLQ